MSKLFCRKSLVLSLCVSTVKVPLAHSLKARLNRDICGSEHPDIN